MPTTGHPSDDSAYPARPPAAVRVPVLVLLFLAVVLVLVQGPAWESLVDRLAPRGEVPAAVTDSESRNSPADADFFRDGAVHLVELDLGPHEIESLRQRPREFVRATVRFGRDLLPDVAVRLKGSTGSFRTLDDKPSLTLDFSRFESSRRFNGLRRLQLNNSVEDPSYLNEELGAELFRTNGVPAPRIAHARVRLNGRSLGLYVLKEGYTAEFLAAYFHRTDGSLYDNDLAPDIDKPMHRNQGPAAGEPALAGLAAAAHETPHEARWLALKDVLDVDQFATFMVLEVILGHRDGYCLARNNFRIYADPESGRFVFLPDGLDQLLGLARYPWLPHMSGLVAVSFMETSEGRRLYRERFDQLLDEAFRPEKLTRRVDELVAALIPSLTWRERTDLAREATNLKERMTARERDLRRQRAEAPSDPSLTGS